MLDRLVADDISIDGAEVKAIQPLKAFENTVAFGVDMVPIVDNDEQLLKACILRQELEVRPGCDVIEVQDVHVPIRNRTAL